MAGHRGRGGRPTAALVVAALLIGALPAVAHPAGAAHTSHPVHAADTSHPAQPAGATEEPPLTVPPVPGAVVAPFDPPEHPYGPGRRGVLLASESGAAVRAARAGTVTFAGEVAGEGWVSVDHGGGLVTSHGPVAPRAVAAGDRVARGALLGHLAEGPSLHWGARIDGDYVDPLDLLTAWQPTLRAR